MYEPAIRGERADRDHLRRTASGQASTEPHRAAPRVRCPRCGRQKARLVWAMSVAQLAYGALIKFVMAKSNGHRIDRRRRQDRRHRRVPPVVHGGRCVRQHHQLCWQIYP